MGEWVMRDRAGAVWHLVESEIGDRKVTKCGRQMAALDAEGRKLWTHTDPTERVCRYCAG